MLKLKIAPELKNLPLIRVGEIQDLQGNLKDLTEIDFNKLLKRLEKKGFKYPEYLWFDENNIPYTLDGNQRNRVIIKAFGNDTKIPYIPVSAKNKIDAKKEILAISSSYGKVTKDGWDGFAFDFTADDVQEVGAEMTFNEWFDVEPEPETLSRENINEDSDDNTKTFVTQIMQIRNNIAEGIEKKKDVLKSDAFIEAESLIIELLQANEYYSR